MKNGSITVRLSHQDIKMIDKKIIEGYFTSRSDVIRHSIRRTLNELDAKKRNLEIIADIAESKNITMNKVRKSLKSIHRETYRDVYGDD